MHIVAGSARATKPARDQRVHDNLVGLTYVGHRRTDRLHPAGVLVPDGVGKLNLSSPPTDLPDMQIGPMRHPADLDDDVERSGGRRGRHLLHLEVLVVANDLDGSHGVIGVFLIV